MQPAPSKETDFKGDDVFKGKDVRGGPTLGPQVLFLALAVALCYANSLRAPFLLDDPFLNNPGARLAYSTRPLVWASWDLNRALGGMETWGYHAFNVLVHFACGLFLLGVLRRGMAHAVPELAARTRAGLAFSVTLLWLCHPLATSAVTYLSQRAESMTACAYLALLYTFQRATSSARPWVWRASTFLALVLGFATKEIFAAAPLLLLLYDALFLASGPLAALRARWRFYGALALATLVLVLVFTIPVVFLGRDVAAGFALDAFGPLDYARSQPGVLLHYLRLAFWPHPLCFDYGWPIATATSEWVPETLVVAALLLAVAVLLLRRSWVGFAGAWCVVVLAPTSSFVPIKDLAFEHRFYLPLAAVLLLAGAGAAWLVRRFLPRARRLLPGLAASAALALAVLTVRRNQDYRTAVSLMERTAECAPDNARAHANLGAALLDAGRPQEAIAPLTRSLGINPRAGLAYNKLGTAYLLLEQVDRAIPFLRRAVEQIEDPRCYDSLGVALYSKGDHAGAAQQFAAALQLDPTRADIHCRFARALWRLQRRDEAGQHYREALRLEPGRAEARTELAALLAEQGGKPVTGEEDARVRARSRKDDRRAPR